MAKMTFLELAKQILQQAKQPMTYQQIWDLAAQKGLTQSLDSTGKTPWQTLAAQLYLNIKRQDSIFFIATKRPTTFWLKSRKDELKEDAQELITKEETESLKNTKYKERDLHPLRVYYLANATEFRLQYKTIYHEKSKKQISGKDKWENPDIVGVYIPFNDYEPQTLEILKHINHNVCSLFSFELKVKVNFGNLKESYFQAVSNSSWANEGYLVIFEDIEDDVLEELRRLNASFGIGVIKLEANPLDSRVLLSAKRSEIDLQTMDRLVDSNPNFREFAADINKQIKAGADTKIQACFDEVLEEEALEKYLKNTIYLD